MYGRVTLACQHCNKEFSSRKSAYERYNTKYCSIECYSLSCRDVIKCENCGKEFTVIKSRSGGRKYCSKKCGGLHKRREKNGFKVCLECGENKSINEYFKHTKTNDSNENLCMTYCKECNNRLCSDYKETDRGRYFSAKARSIKDHGVSWWNLSEELYISLIANSCHYCKGPLNKKGSGLDRKDNSKGYIEGNVVSCCRKCNSVKMHDLTYDEMMRLAPILEDIRLKREGYDLEKNLSEEMLNHY